jgi:phosphoglycolate phosphatase-like HAD superfamily hydrolase
VADLPRDEEVILELLDGPPIRDRYALFSGFARRMAPIYGYHNPGDWGLSLAADYSCRAQEALLTCPERPGALAVLRALADAGAGLYLSSGTPLKALLPIVQGRRMNELFRGIYGGPISKTENLRAILAAETLNPAGVVVVGYSADDRDCATEIGCAFIAVSGGTLGFPPAALNDYHGFLENLDLEFSQ